ncbi:MAG: NTP transferase domain-containing protein [Limimaricola sp.]|uniref:nucleotidyltransferase family protein n=1 Tax=Limimaricola sp. TaxID=2211665 RepID=UPI001D8106E9|nr:nucleotidyltransferase family protein [Limimaricola sp.]MBI1417236.1 NTP transferase domain-containing protein [Limimaricola sp.]
MPASIMMFAAGRGTRMGALTLTRPKALIPVAGVPLLDHALQIARQAGVPRKVVNLHHHGAQIAAHLAGSDVLLSDECGALLETGGGMRKALPLLGPDPVFSLNCDAVWRGDNPLLCLSSLWNPVAMDALLLLVPTSRATGHLGAGDFALTENGQLRRGGDMVYTGAQILRTEGLTDIAEPAFSLNLLWDRMATAGRLFGVVYSGRWCDVGRPENIALAEAMLEGRDG